MEAQDFERPLSKATTVARQYAPEIARAIGVNEDEEHLADIEKWLLSQTVNPAVAGVAAAMCAVLIGVVGFLYWKMQQVQGQAVRPVGQAIAVEMATYGQTMAAPSYVLKAASAPPGRSFCVDCGAAIQGRFCGACGRNQPAAAQPAAEPPFVAPTPNLFRRQPMDINQGAPHSLPVEIISAAGQGQPAEGSVVQGSVVQGSAVQEPAEQGYL